MICKQCGREVPDHAIYCRYCGARFSDKEPRQVSDLKPEPPKRSRRGLIVGILLALALLAGLFFWLRGRKLNKAPENVPADPAASQSEPEAPGSSEPETPVEYALRIEGEDNIEAGKDVVLNAVVEPETEIKRIVWTSSDQSVATVAEGIVTGESKGDTIIRCLVALQSGPVLEAELPFRVLPKPVTYTLHLDPEELEIAAGSSGSFEVIIETEPEGEDTDAEITWESSDTMVAAVTDGRVQAVGEGTAKITARVTLPDGSHQTLTGSVSVYRAEANPTPSASQIQAPQAKPEPTPVPAPAPAPTSDPTPAKPTVTVFDPVGVAPQKTEDYLISNSDKEYLDLNELLKMTDDELVMARNEIYARHGRQFVLDYIREYFEGKSWYQGTVSPAAFDANVKNIFNEYELANVERMVYAEEHN